MTDISNNWLDLSYQSNILKPTYFYGFIDVSNNIVGRENLWIENQTNIGNTRFGLGTLEPSSIIDANNNDPTIRITNTSVTSVTQNNTNLGTIDFVSPIYRGNTGSGYQTSGSIRCENLYDEYNHNGSLVFSTGGDSYNATDKMVIRSDNGNIGIGTHNPNSSLNLEGDLISIPNSNTGDTGTITGFGSMPVGMIIMYYGDMNGKSPNTKLEGTLDNWKLCDGTNYSQYGITTPNLSGRFIVGAGEGNNDYTTGDTGGATTVTLTPDQMPSHTHTQVTGTEAKHYHHLAASEVDDHNYPPTVANTGTTPYAAGTDDQSDMDYGADYTSYSGNHTHTINATGGGGAHENRPPFYALCYIMRVY
jgi:microcystin-dependent protein